MYCINVKEQLYVPGMFHDRSTILYLADRGFNMFQTCSVFEATLLSLQVLAMFSFSVTNTLQ